jgi:hypothetical protein
MMIQNLNSFLFSEYLMLLLFPHNYLFLYGLKCIEFTRTLLLYHKNLTIVSFIYEAYNVEPIHPRLLLKICLARFFSGHVRFTFLRIRLNHFHIAYDFLVVLEFDALIGNLNCSSPPVLRVLLEQCHLFFKIRNQRNWGIPVFISL